MCVAASGMAVVVVACTVGDTAAPYVGPGALTGAGRIGLVEGVFVVCDSASLSAVGGLGCVTLFTDEATGGMSLAACCCCGAIGKCFGC